MEANNAVLDAMRQKKEPSSSDWRDLADGMMQMNDDGKTLLSPYLAGWLRTLERADGRSVYSALLAWVAAHKK